MLKKYLCDLVVTMYFNIECNFKFSPIHDTQV